MWLHLPCCISCSSCKRLRARLSFGAVCRRCPCSAHCHVVRDCRCLNSKNSLNSTVPIMHIKKFRLVPAKRFVRDVQESYANIVVCDTFVSSVGTFDDAHVKKSCNFQRPCGNFSKFIFDTAQLTVPLFEITNKT